MKIGTITFWYSKENYGAMLQCWALLKFINKQGHDARLVKIQTRHWADIKHKWFYKLTNVLTKIFNYSIDEVKRKTVSVTVKKNKNIVDRNFSSFLDKYIPSYPGVYTYEEINNHPLDAEALIVGSDQVWSGFSQTFFLNFKGNYKRISYAPSFGGATFTNPFIRKKISQWLNKFELVTVREKEGVEMCKQLGVNATIVPDPTLLLDKDDYAEIIERKENEVHDYILLYLLGSTIPIEVSEIMAFSKKNNLSVKYVASQGREDEYNKDYPTIEEWLSLFRDSKYVITNSFHGTVFSLIYEKPFLTIPLIGSYSRMNGRIEDLLGKYNLINRIYEGDLNTLFLPIDFSYFKDSKLKDVTMVKGLLNNALSN